jgi:hypothetical protein
MAERLKIDIDLDNRFIVAALAAAVVLSIAVGEKPTEKQERPNINPEAPLVHETSIPQQPIVDSIR